MNTPTFTILLADDDPDDRILVREALLETGLPGHLQDVEDGVQLLDYLARCGIPDTPLPDLILLDLNMPRMDGRETLKALKAHSKYRVIPVIILSTSNAHSDVAFTYQTGGNAYIIKPDSFDGIVEYLHSIYHFWFQTAQMTRAKRCA